MKKRNFLFMLAIVFIIPFGSSCNRQRVASCPAYGGIDPKSSKEGKLHVRKKKPYGLFPK